MEDNILLVGNRNEYGEAVSRLFEQANVGFRWAETVNGALAVVANHSAAVLLDLVLPDGNGIEVLKAIRRAGRGTTVAVLCAGSDSRFLAQVIALHPSAIFGKPLDFEDFVEWLIEMFQETPDFGMAA